MYDSKVVLANKVEKEIATIKPNCCLIDIYEKTGFNSYRARKLGFLFRKRRIERQKEKIIRHRI